MTTDRNRPVSELGEQGVIDLIAARLGPPRGDEIWTGDDAAVFPTPGDTLVSTTDLLVEGVDFELAYSRGSDVGWKLVACNASDAAAMGAAPRYAVCTLALRPTTTVGFVDDFLTGLLSAADRWGMQLVGGDLSSALVLSASLAVIAVPLSGGLVLRSGASPGDAICVTGVLGGAAGGLIALQQGLVGLDAVYAEIEQPTGADGLAVLAARQLRPTARVQEADRLTRVGVTSAMDISDGLARDLQRLTQASGTGCDIDPETIPIDPELDSLTNALPGDVDALTLALAGGEDLELLFTIAADKVEAAQLALDDIGVPVTRVGEMTAGESRIGGQPLEGWSEAGWDHLRRP
jgi:thiamine-monophosphate kinase